MPFLSFLLSALPYLCNSVNPMYTFFLYYQYVHIYLRFVIDHGAAEIYPHTPISRESDLI